MTGNPISIAGAPAARHRTTKPRGGGLRLRRHVPLREGLLSAFSGILLVARRHATAASVDPKRALHDFRKSIRRARSVVALLRPAETRGWVELAANVGDLFSHAARPDDASDYTHKLDLNLLTHLHAFAWTPPDTYLHRVSVYGLLDYVATGLARAGDEVPEGRVFVTDARPLSLVIGLALPLTPANR